MKNIKLNEDYNQASLDSNVSNAFKRAMNGQGDYAFVSFFLKKKNKKKFFWTDH